MEPIDIADPMLIEEAVVAALREHAGTVCTVVFDDDSVTTGPLDPYLHPEQVCGICPAGDEDGQTLMTWFLRYYHDCQVILTLDNGTKLEGSPSEPAAYGEGNIYIGDSGTDVRRIRHVKVTEWPDDGDW